MPRTVVFGPSTASNRTGQALWTRAGTGRFMVACTVTGVCGGSAPVPVTNVWVPTPRTTQPVVAFSPTAHRTASASAGSRTTRVERAIGICQPEGIRFQ